MIGQPQYKELKRPPWRLYEDHLVVCVDDEPAILRALLRLLRREPYEIMTTRNPSEGLEWVKKWDVSLVVADQRMPEMNGTELLRHVEQFSPTTKCIVLTGYPDEDLNRICRNQGIAKLITKPWDDENLRDTIRDFLHQRDIEELESEE